MDDLDAWIRGLRARLERGHVDGGPVTTHGGTLPSAELAAKVMLADLDHYDDLPLERRRNPSVVARRRWLLEDLRQLREQIG